MCAYLPNEMEDLHRGELIDDLVAQYRKELADLTTEELMAHLHLTRQTAQMTDARWAKVAADNPWAW